MTNKRSTTRILVADDDEIMRSSLEALLEAYHYSCTHAENGIQVVSILKQQAFDILLLDLMMPEMDGHQVMQVIKENYPELNIIIVSGDATFNNAAMALRQGAKDFIRKPYKAEDLIKSIRHIEETLKLKHEINLMHQRVLHSEQRYRFFINHSPDLIYMLDKKGRFSFVNDRITELLGYKPKELIGKHYSHIVTSEDLPRLQYILSQNELFPEAKQSIEFQLIHKDPNKHLRCFESDTIIMNMILSDLIKEQPHDRQRTEQIFSGIYGVARDITEKKDYEKQLSFQLYYDSLTSLPNRVLFKDRINYAISQAQRNNLKFAVLSMDIDRFKTINDSLGHSIGDALLCSMSERMNEILRKSDTLARIGGDDFLLLLPDLSSITDIEDIISKVLQILDKPFIVEENEIYIKFNIGISVFPEHGKTSDILIKHAEMAMYQSKHQQTGHYEFFSKQLINQFEPNLSIENGIRKAISENQFEVYFQPQFNINTQKISGVEALIRWNHPVKGLIMPDSFIHIAEETNLICDIGHWMLNSSMKILQQWNKKTELKSIILAINISATQFAQDNFIDIVLETINKYNIDGNQIELEITENIMLDDVQRVVSKLQQLGRHGIRFAIDDFGMGYSSLSYVHQLPLNNLKIDRSFISSIQSSEDSNSIISAIVAMAKDMNMEIVAEGVENEVQLNYIRSLGCPIVQGYYFAKPMKTEDAKNYALSHIN